MMADKFNVDGNTDDKPKFIRGSFVRVLPAVSTYDQSPTERFGHVVEVGDDFARVVFAGSGEATWLPFSEHTITTV